MGLITIANTIAYLAGLAIGLWALKVAVKAMMDIWRE
jgi:hypothetical protein